MSQTQPSELTPMLVTDDERSLIEAWREQRKDDRMRRVKYDLSIDTPLGTAESGSVLDVAPARDGISNVINLSQAARELGIKPVWLYRGGGRPKTRTKEVDNRLVCVEHGDQDMREYKRSGKVYVRCFVCVHAASRKQNKKYRAKMKVTMRPCPKCGEAYSGTSPYCNPCHAKYERDRRASKGGE